MRSNNYKSVLKHAGLAATVLLLASGAAFGQVSLTAGPTTATLPDGAAVPMWGYTCGAAVTGNIGTCTALNPAVQAGTAPAGTWSPVVITVPTGQNLTINLTNSLTFAGGSIPTSLVIVGQLGGGLDPGADGPVWDPGGDRYDHHTGDGVSGRRDHRGGDLQRRHSAAAERNRSGPERGGPGRGREDRIQRDQGVVGSVRRLRQSAERGRNLEFDVPDVLSAGGQLHPAVLSGQRPRFRQDERFELAVCGCAGHRGHRDGAGAPGQCWPADARAVDRRSANGDRNWRLLADRRGRQRAAGRAARAERSVHARG